LCFGFNRQTYIARYLVVLKMDTVMTKQVLGESTFRAAAFWRLLYQVWLLTKNNCPEAFSIGRLGDRDWENEPAHLRTMAYMIIEMNAGTSARSAFLTFDEAILADAAAMLVRAFSRMPELYNKLHMLFIRSSDDSALFSEPTYMRTYTLNRKEEMMGLAAEFNILSKAIEDKEVYQSAKLVHGRLPDQNIYLTLSFHEV